MSRASREHLNECWIVKHSQWPTRLNHAQQEPDEPIFRGYRSSKLHRCLERLLCSWSILFHSLPTTEPDSGLLTRGGQELSIKDLKMRKWRTDRKKKCT
jgi:hypothetical protein